MPWPALLYGCVLIQVEWNQCALRSQLPLNHLSMICVCMCVCVWEGGGGGGTSCRYVGGHQIPAIHYASYPHTLAKKEEEE